MSFNGNEGEQITLEHGAELTNRYRVSSPDSTKSVFYGREQIRALLDQSNCMGVRIYYAKEADGSDTLVLVGADSNENDLLELVIENGQRCPVNCGGSSPLSSNLKGGAK